MSTTTPFPFTVADGVWCCGMCPKQIVTGKKSLISYHKNTHFPKYACETCGSVFAQKCQMDVHIRIAHTGEKPYACSSCDCAFPQLSNLNDHVQKTHGKEKVIASNRKSPLSVAWYNEQITMLQVEYPGKSRKELLLQVTQRCRALRELHGAEWKLHLGGGNESDATSIPRENPGA